MSDEHRAYRAGRPLADIIPPDRRRVKAVGLVLAGMIAGMALLLGVQVWRAQRPPAPQAPIIRSFALSNDRSDVTSPRRGMILPDGQPDWAFDLVVDGSVSAIVLAHSDDAIPVAGGQRWGTIAWDPAAPDGGSHGRAEGGGWQLAVFEGSQALHGPTGALMELGDGTHHLTLHASRTTLFLGTKDYLATGGHVRVYVLGPSHEVVASAPVFIPIDQWPHPDPPPVPVPTPAPTAQGAPFDRGAAAATLGKVRLDHCGKLAGANDGRVAVTFAPDGSASEVSVVEGVDPKSPAARCVSDAFRNNARVPPFAGSPVHVRKSFSLPAPSSPRSGVVQ